jgi:hypothetical protein
LYYTVLTLAAKILSARVKGDVNEKVKFTFTNSEGHELCALLELPEGEVKYHNLFAHCLHVIKVYVVPHGSAGN